MLPRFRTAPAATSPLTDVAVGRTPRNKRRLTRGAAAVVSAAGILALTLSFSGVGLPFVHSSSHSNSSKPGVLRDPFKQLIPYQAGLPYGMTKQQMTRHLGKPEKVAGQCLQYPENLVAWTGRVFNAVRMCFFGGQYQGWFIQIDGIWNTPGIYKAIEPPTTVTAVPLDKTLPDWSKLPHE